MPAQMLRRQATRRSWSQWTLPSSGVEKRMSATSCGPLLPAKTACLIVTMMMGGSRSSGQGLGFRV